jgi:hypothetical protein
MVLLDGAARVTTEKLKIELTITSHTAMVLRIISISSSLSDYTHSSGKGYINQLAGFVEFVGFVGFIGAMAMEFVGFVGQRS